MVEFDWTAFAREFCYNYFHWLILPLIIYNEGWTGARSRVYYGFDFGKRYVIQSGIVNLLIWICNIVYFAAFSKKLQREYLLDLFMFNAFHIARVMVIAIKWGYLPSAIFEVMRQQVLTQEQC